MNITKQSKNILRRMNKNETPHVIPITLDSIMELTYKHDPHSTEESKLNLVIEEYLIDEVDQVPLNVPVQIELHFNQKHDDDAVRAGKIITNNFKRVLNSELFRKKREMKHWRINLTIGIGFLAVCMFMSQLFNSFGDRPWMEVLKETFSIIGWVALWDPASYFLYGWREDREKITTAIRLQNAIILAV